MGSKATHLQQTCKQARYSMSRFNNQLPCEPLSNAEFCKVQLICYRNERLANCNSPQPVHPSVCLLWKPEGQENERQQQPESDANSLVTVSAVRVRASMKSVWCVWIDVGVWMAQQERDVWGDHLKPEDKDASTGWSSYIHISPLINTCIMRNKECFSKWRGISPNTPWGFSFNDALTNMIKYNLK